MPNTVRFAEPNVNAVATAITNFAGIRDAGLDQDYSTGWWEHDFG